MREPCRYRCVAFDAVGTLIRPEPSVAQAYFTIGGRYGGRLSVDEIRRRFTTSMAGRLTDLTTSEPKEREFWRETVDRVLGPLADPIGCFEEVYAHFAQPAAWRPLPGAGETLRTLADAGVAIAVASNFDIRLHQVLDGLPELAAVRYRVISSEIGWRKPSPNFFRALSELVRCAPEELLMVGDGLENDVFAARGCRMDAVHLDSNGTSSDDGTIRSLPEVLAHCGVNA